MKARFKLEFGEIDISSSLSLLLVALKEMSRVMRKQTFMFSELVRHKRGCTVTEDG